MVRGGSGASRRVVAAIVVAIMPAAGAAPAAAVIDRHDDPSRWTEALRWWFPRSASTPSWWTPRTPAPETPSVTPKPPPETPAPPKPPPPPPGPKTPPVTIPASPTPPPEAPPVTDVAPTVAPPAPAPPAAPVAVPTAAPAPRVELRKSGPARVRAGAVARFRVTVANRGTGPARGVRVVDVLPAGFSVVRAGSPGVRLSSGRPGWRIARLDAGTTRTLVITVRASSQMRPRAYCNRVRATAPGTTPAAGRACFTVTAAPPLRRAPAVTG